MRREAIGRWQTALSLPETSRQIAGMLPESLEPVPQADVGIEWRTEVVVERQEHRT